MRYVLHGAPLQERGATPLIQRAGTAPWRSPIKRAAGCSTSAAARHRAVVSTYLAMATLLATYVEIGQLVSFAS